MCFKYLDDCGKAKAWVYTLLDSFHDSTFSDTQILGWMYFVTYDFSWLGFFLETMFWFNLKMKIWLRFLGCYTLQFHWLLLLNTSSHRTPPHHLLPMLLCFFGFFAADDEKGTHEVTPNIFFPLHFLLTITTTKYPLDLHYNFSFPSLRVSSRNEIQEDEEAAIAALHFHRRRWQPSTGDDSLLLSLPSSRFLSHTEAPIHPIVALVYSPSRL